MGAINTGKVWSFVPRTIWREWNHPLTPVYRGINGPVHFFPCGGLSFSCSWTRLKLEVSQFFRTSTSSSVLSRYIHAHVHSHVACKISKIEETRKPQIDGRKTKECMRLDTSRQTCSFPDIATGLQPDSSEAVNLHTWLVPSGESSVLRVVICMCLGDLKTTSGNQSESHTEFG